MKAKEYAAREAAKSKDPVVKAFEPKLPCSALPITSDKTHVTANLSNESVIESENCERSESISRESANWSREEASKARERRTRNQKERLMNLMEKCIANN